MKHKKIIIGLVGETGSGKDTAADYLKENYGAETMRFADPIKKTLSIYFDKMSKQDQQWLYLVFRRRFGDDILCRALEKRIKDKAGGLIVVNGLRMPCDYEFIKGHKNSYILYITAGQRTRWQRVAERGEKSDDNVSFEEFQRLDREKTEVHIPQIGAKADFTVKNEKDLRYLFSEIDRFMGKIGIRPLKKMKTR